LTNLLDLSEYGKLARFIVLKATDLVESVLKGTSFSEAKLVDPYKSYKILSGKIKNSIENNELILNDNEKKSIKFILNDILSKVTDNWATIAFELAKKHFYKNGVYYNKHLSKADFSDFFKNVRKEDNGILTSYDLKEAYSKLVNLQEKENLSYQEIIPSIIESAKSKASFLLDQILKGIPVLNILTNQLRSSQMKILLSPQQSANIPQFAKDLINDTNSDRFKILGVFLKYSDEFKFTDTPDEYINDAIELLKQQEGEYFWFYLTLNKAYSKFFPELASDEPTFESNVVISDQIKSFFKNVSVNNNLLTKEEMEDILRFLGNKFLSIRSAYEMAKQQVISILRQCLHHENIMGENIIEKNTTDIDIINQYNKNYHITGTNKNDTDIYVMVKNDLKTNNPWKLDGIDMKYVLGRLKKDEDFWLTAISIVLQEKTHVKLSLPDVKDKPTQYRQLLEKHFKTEKILTKKRINDFISFLRNDGAQVSYSQFVFK